MGHVAVLGTGLLGAGFVEQFRKRGLEVHVWNRSPDKARALQAHGAVVAADPAEAVRGAERVHLILSDDRAVDEVVERMWPDLKAQVFDHSTVLPAGVVRRVEQFTRAGRSYVHAPVFMGPQNARDATGIMLLSGPPAETEAAAEVVRPMTGRVLVVGPRVDAAAAFKLFGNAAIIGMAAAMSDVLALARAQQFDEGSVLELFKGFDPSIGARARAARIAARDFRPASFTLEMARKDVRLMLEMAEQATLTVLPAIAKRMDERIAGGDGDADFGVMGRP